MSTKVYEAGNGKAKLEIHTDTGAEGSRQWDNAGNMVCFHSRYSRLGDEHSYKDVEQFLESLIMKLGYDLEYVIDPAISRREYRDACLEFLANTDEIVMLPLYVYEHGGMTMRTRPYSCPWDSGQVGWIYMTLDQMKECFILKDEEIEKAGNEKQAYIEKAKKVMQAEVEEYDKFLRGDVYGFILYEIEECGECGTVLEEVIESVWGFYGDDFKTNGMKEHIPEEYEYLLDELEHI